MIKTIELLKYCNLERKDFITDKQRDLIWVSSNKRDYKIKDIIQKELYYREYYNKDY